MEDFDFGDLFGDLFSSLTPYKIVKLKSGRYGVTFKGELLDYRSDSKQDAIGFKNYLIKNYKGV